MVQISTKSELMLGDEVNCEVTITNNHDKDYYLLLRNTPLQGLRSHMFSVSTSGKEIPYDSILVKQCIPKVLSKEHFALIKAKSSLVSSVDLSEAYSFSSAGAYTVQLRTRFELFADNPNNISVQHVASNHEEFWLHESENQPKLTMGQLVRTRTTAHSLESPLRHEAAAINRARSLRFDGVTTRQREQEATSAFNAAYAVMTPSYKAATPNNALYQEWFGNINNRQKVRIIYSSMKKSMEKDQYTIYFNGPECTPDDCAYTYYRNNVIYTCTDWYKAPAVGFNSKMGTVVHEMTHILKDTEDYEYGRTACRNLAQTNPNKAVNNADNYAYFSECLKIATFELV